MGPTKIFLCKIITSDLPEWRVNFFELPQLQISANSVPWQKRSSRCLFYLYLRKLMCPTHFAQDQFFYRLFRFWSFVSQSFRNHLILWRSYVIHLSNTLLLLFSWLYLLHSSKTCIYLFLSSWPPVFWNLRKKVLHWFISLRMDPSINA